MADQLAAAGRERPGPTEAETADQTLHLVQGDEAAPAPAPPVVLLETKLQPPVHRPAVVPRPRLVALLDQGSPGQVTLVDAPAGWGKTSLLAEWHATAADADSFAWLALDSADNDPVRFWTYVIEALRQVRPGIGERAVAALGAPGTTASDITLPTLINDLVGLGSPIVLVLDDYHLVTNAEVHDAMAFLVEHLPATLHLVVATRHDPPLPLARLRVRRKLVEVRASDLRFTEEESFDLLNAVLGLGLDPADSARLHRRTEGWAAGLRLAALSLRGRSDAGGFISAFAGDDRHIVDYLGSEVLDAQPPAVRHFLLRTSILDRLSGPLCDAVLATHGSAHTLELIERENLFLVPLDNRRKWYRYHHLFAELLRHELRRTEGELVPELHRRAGAWCRDAGLADEAIHHAIAGGSLVEAGELIVGHWPAFVALGQQETVAAWLRELPDGAVQADARLCLVEGWLALMGRRLDEAAAWIEKVESAPAADPPGDGATSFASNAALLGGFVHHHRGDATRACTAARRAVELERDGVPLWQSASRLLLEASRWLLGETAEAMSGLDEVGRLARCSNGANPLAAAYAFGLRALLSALAGDLETAAAAVADFDAVLAGVPALDEHFGAAVGFAARASLLRHEGDIEGAVAAVDHALRVVRRGGSRNDDVLVQLAAAEVRRAVGDHLGADRHVVQARKLVAGLPDPGMLVHLVGRTERTSPRSTPAALPPAEALSDREREVLRLLTSPLSLREIGRTLYVSPNTVKTHVRGIYAKLGVSSRGEAVTRAREQGLA